VRKLLIINVTEVANGVLLTLEQPVTPSATDPLAQRGGFTIGPTYYPSVEAAIADIHPVLAVREATKALIA
jgi:hypothetical protein